MLRPAEGRKCHCLHRHRSFYAWRFGSEGVTGDRHARRVPDQL